MGGLVALGLKKEKKTIAEMLDEKIAQAQKTPIAGQVKALRELKTRLTTDEGKGILSKVVSGIIDPIADALGFGEEEKKKAKAVSGTVAGQDPKESDDATKEAVATSLRPQLRPDGLQTTAENFREAEANLFDDRSNYIVEPGDLEATNIPTTPELPRVRELQSDLVKLDGGEVLRKELFQPEANIGMFGRENSIDEPPNIAMPEEPTVTVPSLTEPDSEKNVTFESFTPTDAEALKTKISSVDQLVTAKDDLRNSINDLVTYGESRAIAKSSLEGFGEDASSQAIKSYLEKAMDNVNSIVEGTDTSPTKPAVTAPVQGGSDDDDGPSFPTAPTSNVGNLQGMSTAEKTAAVAEKTDNLSPTARTGGVELDSALGISGLNRGGFAKKRKKKK